MRRQIIVGEILSKPEQGVNQIDKDIFKLHNQIRQDPKYILADLQQMLDKFEDMVYLKRPGRSTLKTAEGINAVYDCIEFIQRQQPVVPLNWSTSVALAARDHAEDIGPKGLVTHKGTVPMRHGQARGLLTSQNAKDRMRKYGKVQSKFGESLSYGDADAKEIILNLLIDDGSRSRGHRINFFNPDFNFIGSYTGDHQRFRQVTCVNYAAGFVANGDVDPIEKQMKEFLNEEVVCNSAPQTVSWKQHSTIQVKGTKAVKTTTRTCKLKDGTRKEIQVVNEKVFDFRFKS